MGKYIECENIMMMTKEEVFRSTQGGFSAGVVLPHEDGDLEGFEVVYLEAQK